MDIRYQGPEIPPVQDELNKIQGWAANVQKENVEMRGKLAAVEEVLAETAQRFHYVCSKRKKAGRRILALRLENAELISRIKMLHTALDAAHAAAPPMKVATATIQALREDAERLQRRIVTLENEKANLTANQSKQTGNAWELERATSIITALTEERNHYRTIAGGVIDKVATDKTADLEAKLDYAGKEVRRLADKLSKKDEQIFNLDRANNEKAAEIRQLKAKLTVIHESSDPQSAVTIERGF